MSCPDGASADTDETERTGSVTLHASCVARDGAGVLLIGKSGAGKSDLALRLLDRGFSLVADDRVRIDAGMANPPAALAGLIEVRGLGLLRVRPVFPARLVLVVDLDRPADRLPLPRRHAGLGLPLLRFDAFDGSTTLKIGLALDCLHGDRNLVVGGL
jgi:HPr kinase/phosphorylase